VVSPAATKRPGGFKERKSKAKKPRRVDNDTGGDDRVRPLTRLVMPPLPPEEPLPTPTPTRLPSDLRQFDRPSPDELESAFLAWLRSGSSSDSDIPLQEHHQTAAVDAVLEGLARLDDTAGPGAAALLRLDSLDALSTAKALVVQTLGQATGKRILHTLTRVLLAFPPGSLQRHLKAQLDAREEGLDTLAALKQRVALAAAYLEVGMAAGRAVRAELETAQGLSGDTGLPAALVLLANYKATALRQNVKCCPRCNERLVTTQNVRGECDVCLLAFHQG